MGVEVEAGVPEGEVDFSEDLVSGVAASGLFSVGAEDDVPLDASEIRYGFVFLLFN